MKIFSVHELMKKSAFLATFVLAAFPALLAAQDRMAFGGDPGGSRSILADGPRPFWDRNREMPPEGSGQRESLSEVPELSSRGMGALLLQEEFFPRLQFSLGFYARLDVPGDTDVSNQGVLYSDIFDVGFGLNVEASAMQKISPHWSLGGYLSVGWDRFAGASDVDMGTGEFFSFNDQDVVTVIAGAKLLQKITPFLFWEGRMGLGLVHYSSLSFSDVTLPVTVSGLQFFRPVSHGLFDIAGRIGFGDPRITFDVGLDFRFMGGEARGRDVTAEVDPSLFFVFAIDLGLTFRF